jgi:hypothetical protein
MQAFLLRLAPAALVLSVAQILLAGSPAGLPETASAGVSGTVTLVPAVPGRTVDVRVDGRLVRRAAGVGELVGPVRLPAGRHTVAFIGATGGTGRAVVRVTAGSSQDVVLHQPAAAQGRAVVSSFRTPTRPLAPGRARLLISPTASVVPADVRVDGRVVFTNIANGEVATVEVPAGVHRVALVPTGRTTPAVVGPLEVAVAAGTVTKVYAMGGRGSADDSIVHSVALGSGGEVAPGRVETGTVGLARDLTVRVFDAG